MSFIAGYLMGLDEGGGAPTYIDPRIAKLTDNKAYPPLWVCGIEDGWNIRVKFASDIDNARVYKFGDRHHGIQHYSEWWTIYYCVYHNDDFKFAACKNPFYMKYWEDYQNLDVPNRLYAIYSYSDFLISEGSLSFNSSTGLSVNVEGTFIQSVTGYSWTNDVDRIEGEMRLYAKIRYNQKEQPAAVTQLPDGRIRVVFDEPQRAVASGQAVVLYDGEYVVGGGTII